MDNPQIINHIERSVNYSIHDTKWIPCSAKFVTLGCRPNGTGSMQVFEFGKNGIELVATKENKNPFKCGTFASSSIQDRHLCTGDFDGNLNVWDLDELSNPIYSAKDHSKIINCIDGVGGLGIGKGAPEIVTGSRDGCVKVWDVRQKERPVVNIVPEEGTVKRDCWAVSFGNSHSDNDRCVCSGYDNGDVKLFDLRAMNIRWETNVKNGVCSIEFDRKNIEMNKLVVTSLESKIHAYDLRTFHPVKGYASTSIEAHDSTIWVVKHLPQDRDIFMTCGGNGSLNLWKYCYPSKRHETENGQNVGVAGKLNKLQSINFSNQPITSFDWNIDKRGLALCSGLDQTVRVIIVTKLNRI